MDKRSIGFQRLRLGVQCGELILNDGDYQLAIITQTGVWYRCEGVELYYFRRTDDYKIREIDDPT